MEKEFCTELVMHSTHTHTGNLPVPVLCQLLHDLAVDLVT